MYSKHIRTNARVDIDTHVDGEVNDQIQVDIHEKSIIAILIQQLLTNMNL